MRTMNKIVALSLVLAMALSMMAGAAFKDQATINADLVDEINLLVALGVYSENGTGAGYFEPNMTITRAQAAKMMYVLKNKGNDNGATSWTGLNIFKDVEEGAWYEGYANYCASTAIMVGDGEYFNPNGQITGVEFAKMLLVLIGYKPDVEGYTGAKWADNVLEDAESIGLFVDYEFPVRAVATREWAAKLIVNALNAEKVNYFLGEQFGAGTTYANEDLSLETLNGVVKNTGKVGYGATAVLNENGTKATVGTTEINMLLDVEWLGQDVNVIYKDANNNNVYDNNEKVYGVTASGKTIVVDMAIADLKKITSGDDAGKITIDGVKYANDVVVETYNAYAKVATGTLNGYADKATHPENVRFVITKASGSTPASIVAFRNIPTFSIVDTYNVAKETFKTVDAQSTPATVVNATKSGEGVAKFANYKFNDTVAKGDVVAITVDNTSGKVVYVVDKVDTVIGPITTATATSATIGGTAYKQSTSVVNGFSMTFNPTKDNVTFYVYNNVVVYSSNVVSAAAQTNVALVTGKANGAAANVTTLAAAKPAKVELLLADGTTAVYEYALKDKQASGFINVEEGNVLPSSIAVDTMYEYQVVDGVLSLKALSGGTDTGVVHATASTSAFDKNLDRFTVGTKVYLTNDESYFFVKKAGTLGTDAATDKYAVVKASEIEVNLTNNLGQFAANEEAIPTVLFGVINTSVAATSTDSVYAFVTGDAYTGFDSKDNTVVYLPVTDKNGNAVTLNLGNVSSSNTVTAAAALKNEIVTYTVNNSTGVATVTEITASNFNTATGLGTAWAQGEVDAVNGNLVSLDNGTKLYTLDEKVIIKNVDTTSGKAKLVEGEEIVVSVSNAQNVIYKTKTSNNVVYITEIIVEVDGAVFPF